MKTKIIPFDLETAKKIQAGEIEGKIITKNKIPCRIVAYCNSGDMFIQRTTLESHCDWCYPYTRKGCYIDGHLNGGTDYDLVLEVPDNEPQFNPSYSIEQLNKLKEYTEQLMEVNQGVIDDLDSAMHKIRKICNLQKTEFKPFDKVLVRSKDNTNNRWLPAIYAYYDDVVSHVTIDHRMYAEEDCIPYEGNEHLVGTSNSQDED